MLTDAERRKVIAYCRRQVESAEGMMRQFEKLGIPDAVKGELVKNEKLKVLAYDFVARDLERMESMTIE